MQTLYSVLQYVPFINRLLGVSNLRRTSINTQNYSNELAHSVVFRHACKVPLTALLMSLSQLQQQTARGGEDIKPSIESDSLQTVELSLTATKRLMTLLEELDCSVPTVRSFDVFEALQEVKALLVAQQQGCHLHFHLHLQPNCRIQGAQLHFEEALICLVTNAIEAYTEDHTAKIVVVLAYQTDSMVLRVEVLDFGVGMTDVVKQLALMPGVSSKEQGQGVGLSFAKDVVENVFAGQLTVASQVGIGTRVRIELPLAPGNDSQNLER